MSDHYATLNVSRTATDKEIRSAYLRRSRECHEELEELRRRAAELEAELEQAEPDYWEATQRSVPQRPATHRPATAPHAPHYYISSTGGGSCYHLTPTCRALRQAGATRVSSRGGRRLCSLCANVNEKPLFRAPPSAVSSSRHIYYTTRTGKKYHKDRCCSGLRNANSIFEERHRPALEPCRICC